MDGSGSTRAISTSRRSSSSSSREREGRRRGRRRSRRETREEKRRGGGGDWSPARNSGREPDREHHCRSKSSNGIGGIERAREQHGSGVRFVVQ